MDFVLYNIPPQYDFCKTAPSGEIKHYLSPVGLAARRQAQPPANPDSGASKIAPSHAGVKFAVPRAKSMLSKRR